MSTDYASKEREFLDSLKADTGRDCGEWMQAIASAALPHRNDIIDWLRQQGFPFSRASWLERIHHNGGRPIYADGPARPAPTRRPAKAASQAAPAAQATAAVQLSADQASRPVVPVAQPSIQAQVIDTPAAPSAPAKVAAPVPSRGSGTPEPAPSPVATQSNQPLAARAEPSSTAPLGPAQIQDFFAPAKAYRPLAQYLLAAIQRELPATSVRLSDGLLILSAPAGTGQPPGDFAAILPSTRDIRLGLDGGDANLGRHMLGTRLPGAPAWLMHTVVLDDARQVNADLLAVVKGSLQRADGKRG